MISMSLSHAADTVDGILAGKDVTFNGCSTDTRTLENGNLFIALRGEHFDGHSFITSATDRGAVAALVEERKNEGLLPLLVIKDSVKAMGMLAAHWRSEFDIPLLAITGSNGKTTVKEMVTSILGLTATVLSTKGNLNNHIGVPLTLFKLGREHKYAVIEMGANHSGEIAWLSQLAKPTVALITQCAPAHLEGFGSEDGVARAKAEIFGGMGDNGIAIVNADDKYAGFWKGTAYKHRQISFGLENTANIMATGITHDTDSGRTSFLIHFPGETILTSIPLSGIHNVQNSIAAAACCMALDIPVLEIKAGLEKMESVAGRMQMLNIRGGSRLFDDSYNANPGSLKAGLQVLSTYKGNRCLILGDMVELGNCSAEHHRHAGELAREHGIQHLYALGDLTPYAVEGFGNGARHFTSMDDLISTVKHDLTSGSTILVKGSRVMGMERIVKSLIGEY
jgi:UDP-N-acetylmuramoyl-tripeptide--D-alanyl-D-alanine ligase